MHRSNFNRFGNHMMQKNWSVHECRRVDLLTITEQTRGQCFAAAETKFGRIDSAIEDQGGDSVHQRP
jgi:hypothetical protein